MGKSENNPGINISRLRGQVAAPARPLNRDDARLFEKLLRDIEKHGSLSLSENELFEQVAGLSPREIGAKKWGHYDSKTNRVYWIGNHGRWVVSRLVNDPGAALTVQATLMVAGRLGKHYPPDFYARECQIAASILSDSGWQEESRRYRNLAEDYFQKADELGYHHWAKRPAFP